MKQPERKRDELNNPGRLASEEVVSNPTPIVGSAPSSTVPAGDEQDGIEEELEVTTVIQVCK